MKTIDFRQIIYRHDQAKCLYSFANSFFNEELTPYFENTVIAELVPKSEADFISICSWRLREKRQQGATPILLGNQELTLERIQENDFDIAILCPVDQHHKTMECSSAWHGVAWDDAIAELGKFISIPDELEGNAIYQNHFIARKEIYKSYVSECLAPTLQYMRDKEVFFRPSGYIKKKRDQEEIRRTLAKLGMDDWPIAPFVLERLFRIWIDKKDFKIINL